MSRLVIAHDAEECECCEVSLALKAQRDELLAVAKRFVDAFDGADGMEAAMENGLDDAVVEARAAIAKAEGER